MAKRKSNLAKRVVVCEECQKVIHPERVKSIMHDRVRHPDKAMLCIHCQQILEESLVHVPVLLV